MNTVIPSFIHAFIGETPLIRLERLSPSGGAVILAKMEHTNPGGSVKDRIAFSMIRAAEEAGDLHPGMTIVEATSGNTGIGLAMLSARMGYGLVLTMPETLSYERRALVSRYGARVVLTPGEEGMTGAVRRAEEIVSQNENCLALRQFENPANPEAHRRTTGPEILRQTGGVITEFVAGVGTGGTITGVGEVLKAFDSSIRIVAVEPAASAVLSGRRPGAHAIEGIGAGFVPSILNRQIIDEIVTIDDRAAFHMTQSLAEEEGLLVGISSGANVLAARKIAEKQSSGATVVTVLCDTGTRYFSIEEYFSQEYDKTSGMVL
ncbi:MAG: cysteine synthase A [candidate division Zixibacteria bacterium]|nr:cysteine synthase A [candidate division Zixibacteria bacterium]